MLLNFLKLLLKDIKFLIKELHTLYLFLVHLSKDNNFKIFLVNLDLKFSEKLIYLIDLYIARQERNRRSWLELRNILITQEIHRFVPWLHRLVEVRIPFMIVDPRNDLLLYWFFWISGWNMSYFVCDAFMIKVNEFNMARYFFEYFIFYPPICYYSALFSKIMMYISARVLFYIRRHKWPFLTTKKDAAKFLKVFDIVYAILCYYYWTENANDLYFLRVSHILTNVLGVC